MKRTAAAIKEPVGTPVLPVKDDAHWLLIENLRRDQSPMTSTPG
jgi:hypothetical protein